MRVAHQALHGGGEGAAVGGGGVDDGGGCEVPPPLATPLREPMACANVQLFSQSYAKAHVPTWRTPDASTAAASLSMSQMLLLPAASGVAGTSIPCWLLLERPCRWHVWFSTANQ